MKPVHIAGPTDETLAALRGSAAPERLLFLVQARCSSSSLHLRSQVCLATLIGDVQVATQPFKVLARFVPRRSCSNPVVSPVPAATPASRTAPVLQSPDWAPEASLESVVADFRDTPGTPGPAVVVVRVLRAAPSLWNLIDHIKCTLQLQLSRMPHLLSQELTQFEDLIIVVARFSRRESALLTDAEIARFLCVAGGMLGLVAQ
eukprot:m51a1_g1439 hypothetical protein (204) ;mRNA; r:119428-120302